MFSIASSFLKKKLTFYKVGTVFQHGIVRAEQINVSKTSRSKGTNNVLTKISKHTFYACVSQSLGYISYHERRIDMFLIYR